jgi:hypothetical protein
MTKDGITTFTIKQDVCSNVDYGDGRGESDCFNGNMRSQVQPSFLGRVPSSMTYSFHVRVDGDFNYKGFNNYHPTARNNNALKSYPHDSRLRIAYWEGQYLHNFIYHLKLDATKGITFASKVCIAPERLSEWNYVQLDVKWTNNKTGTIALKCNDLIVYQESNIQTNVNPECYIQNQCRPGVFPPHNPKTIRFVVGPWMAGYGRDWKTFRLNPKRNSQFEGLGAEQIVIQMKEIKIITK